MKIGSLVELINDKNWKNPIRYMNSIGVIYPVKGVIYTVRDIDYNIRFIGDEPGIRLEEIVNPPIKFSDTDEKVEMQYLITLFREIQPPMDISIEQLISEPEKV